MAYSDEVLADSPLLYWQLEDVTGSTTVSDASGNGSPGTINGAWNLEQGPTHVTGSTYANTAGGGYLISPVIAFGSNDVTVELWLDVVASQSYMPFSFGVSDLDVWITAGRVGINTASGDQYGCAISDGPHHLVVVMPNNKATTNAKIYIDGAPQTLSGTSGVAPSLSSCTFQVSGWARDGNYRIPAGYQVDEIAIYSGELSAGRIATHFSIGAKTSSIQAESVYADIAAAGTGFLQGESVYADIVAAGTPEILTGSVYVELVTRNIPAYRGWGIGL